MVAERQQLVQTMMILVLVYGTMIMVMTTMMVVTQQQAQLQVITDCHDDQQLMLPLVRHYLPWRSCHSMVLVRHWMYVIMNPMIMNEVDHLEVYWAAM